MYDVLQLVSGHQRVSVMICFMKVMEPQILYIASAHKLFKLLDILLMNGALKQKQANNSMGETNSSFILHAVFYV